MRPRHAEPSPPVHRGTVGATEPHQSRHRFIVCVAARWRRWLHEIKHDGHRLVAILDGHGGLKLISRGGHDRTPLFGSPFFDLLPFDREIVLDGEIAVPDDRGVTHISELQDAIAGRRPERLAYFAFDLLHLDGHDLRRCRIEERKALLRKALDDARCPRLVYVDHVARRGNELFDHVRAVGAEGIVSKRLGSCYKAGPSWDWRKTKCHATGRFFVTGFQELGPGRLEVLHVAEAIGHELVTAGQVRFGFGGKGLWAVLDELRAGPVGRGGVIAIEPGLAVQVKFFGRYKGGAIRDGVLLAVEQGRALPAWSCDSDAVVAAMEAERSA
jgi:ATP-dependent DNA ligase